MAKFVINGATVECYNDNLQSLTRSLAPCGYKCLSHYLKQLLQMSMTPYGVDNDLSEASASWLQKGSRLFRGFLA